MSSMFAISLLAVQAAQVVVSEDWARAERRPASPAPAVPVQLADRRISQAVAETLAATPDRVSIPANQQEALRGQELSAESYRTFTKQFAYAKVPYCLGDNGLKFQPPKIGPVGFTGLLAIPFAVLAKVRGKCK